MKMETHKCPTCKKKLYKIRSYYYHLRGKKWKVRTCYRCIFCEKIISFTSEFEKPVGWKPEGVIEWK